MTKPAVPPPARPDAIEVEIDAMDLAEWESGQSTPQASDANLAELVRRTAATPEAGVRLAATRERTRTQIGAAPAVRPSGQAARTAPPGPAPRPARPRTSAEGSAAPRPADAAPAAPPPAQPALPPVPGPTARSVATPPKGVDFSLPVTAAGEADAPRLSLPLPPPAALDFDLPVTSTGETTRSFEPYRPPGAPPAPAPALPPSAPSAPSGIDFAVPVTATSQSGARRPGSDPPAAVLTPTPSPFAEASQVGPGRNAVPPVHPEPNTAWPPRPRPTEPWARPEPPAPGDAIAPPPARESRLSTAPSPSPSPAPDAAGDAAPVAKVDGAERLQVLSRRRLYWIAGAIGGTAIAAVVAAASFGSSEQAAAPATPAGAASPAAAARTPAGAATDGDADDADADAGDATTARAAAGATGARRAAPIDPAARALSAQQTWRLAIGAVEGLTDSTVGPAPRPKRHVGPTRVVIDYRARPNEPLPAATAPVADDDPAIDSARGAYNRGNQRLFVGDLEGAVRAYRESLDLYPGYVGGYRGLGLAYAELGEKSAALDALRAYVAAAPGARDIALIKKRIARLQSK